MNHCYRCPLRLANRCDFVSELCRLTVKQVVADRPDLIKDVGYYQRWLAVHRPQARRNWRRHYVANRDKKIAAASERQKANRAEVSEYQRRYRARVNGR